MPHFLLNIKFQAYIAGADIYAFGGVAVELLGKAVWEGLHPYQIITKVYDQCLLCARLCIISEL